MTRTPTIDNHLTVSAPDGTSIAYSVAGRGPALVLSNGLTTTSFFWKYLRPRWLRRHTVVTWDFPGHGASGPAKSARSATIEGQPALLARVMDAAGVQRATQIGWSVGCQVVLETYRQLPARCNAVVALFGPAEHALSNTALPVPGAWLDALLAQPRGVTLAALIQRLAQAAALPGVAPLLRGLGLIGEGTSTADLRHLIGDLGRVDPGTGQRMARSAEAHSAHDVLARLRVPFLIMAGDKDPFAPPGRVGVPMHRAAPGSEFVRLPHATHTALLDHADEIGAVVDDFLRRRVKDGRAQSN